MLLGEIEWAWQPWGPTWIVASVMAALFVFIFWLYRIDGRRLSKAQRRFLLMWRVLSVFVILILLTEPSYKLTEVEPRAPVAAIVVDESKSMEFPDATDSPWINYFGETERAKKSRYAAAKKAAEAMIKDLSKTHRVKVYKVSDGVVSVADYPQDPKGETTNPETAFAPVEHATPSGNFSNLAEVVKDIMEQNQNAKLSTLVLISDGRITGGPKWSDAADEAVARKQQINTIAVGSQDPLADLGFTDLAAPPEANINDPMTIMVTIINTLRPNLKVKMTMFEDEGKEPINTQEYTLPLGEKRVSITTIPRREGEIKYTLKLPTYPEELDHENNTTSFHVNVVKRRLKILFIAGAPTMEFHHLVPSVSRDKVIDCSVFLQTADVNAVQQGNDVIEELPRTPAEWSKYDAVLLYDIDPNKFNNDQEVGLENLVSNGGGLFFIAGRTHGMAALMQVRGNKMKAMLPVEINKNLHPNYDDYFTEPFHIVRTSQGERHPILIFAPGKKDNDDVWRSFSDLNFFWNHPVMGLKRQAVPLLVKDRKDGDAANREVIMALMKYGNGSTVFLGVHNMWLWRFPTENYDYDQFWSQTARYLAEYRMLGAQRTVVLNTDKKIYAPGEQVRVILSILDPALETQLKIEQVFATITDPEKGEYKVLLRPTQKDPSNYYGFFAARRLGEHTVAARHVLAADLAAKKALFDEKKHFMVKTQSLEFKDTTADLAGLKELAERTGGLALDHSNSKGSLPQMIAGVNSDPQLIPHESFDDLWDRWYVLAVLLCMGTVELWFRRVWGLL